MPLGNSRGYDLSMKEVEHAERYQFGISNYMPADVQRIYDIQSAAKSVLPTVYQGNYNAVARHVEQSLFPLLRNLNISFYACESEDNDGKRLC